MKQRKTPSATRLAKRLVRVATAMIMALSLGYSATVSADHIMSDGFGGYYTPDGHITSDGFGGYYTPDGHITSDGFGGYYTPDGHVTSDGFGGFYTP